MIWNRFMKSKASAKVGTALPPAPQQEPWPFDTAAYPELMVRNMVKACVRYQASSGSVLPEEPHLSHSLEEIARSQPQRLALRRLWREEASAFVDKAKSQKATPGA